MRRGGLAFATVCGALLVAPQASRAAPAAVAGAAAERLDALDFDNGGFLVETTESFGARTDKWSPWHLSDGSDEPDQGWCSAKGKAAGSSFAWELDGTWRLETLVLSTKNLQEKSYAGISAKTVELFVAPSAGGAWKSLGKFGVGKDERREHALPKGPNGNSIEAQRVKLVVLENHGHADYSELAEVDVLGKRAAGPANGGLRKIDGSFETNFGPMRFMTEGDQVFGCYDWHRDRTSLVWGTLIGRTARVTWWEGKAAGAAGQAPDVDEGTATFALTLDGERLWGVWYKDGALKGEWAGPRVPPGKGPKCVPERKAQVAESLRRAGRVVLYGIRFDTGADVPRADSDSTLQQLLEALRAQGSARVAVEGHTDAVAGDAYNLDLSNRRARAVVAWLVKRGLPAARLEAKGYGRTRPVADNATAEGRALNRRVEVSILK